MDSAYRVLSAPLFVLSLMVIGCPNGGGDARITITGETYVSPVAAVPDAKPRQLPCSVEARSGWQATGVVCERGDILQINAIGTWSPGSITGWIDAGGREGWQSSRYVPIGRYMELIGRIGNGYPFVIGRGTKVRVLTEGQLQLRPNKVDRLLFHDKGAVSAQVELYAGGKPKPTHGAVASCDLRIIRASDGSAVTSASGEASLDNLGQLVAAVSAKLKDGMMLKGETIAVVSLRNRSGTTQGKVVADELADKLAGALVDSGWFDVKERIELRSILTEKDLDTAGIVRNLDVQKKLAGVKYVVIGGVTVREQAGNRE